MEETLVNHGTSHLSTGAGFLPSTVVHVFFFSFDLNLTRSFSHIVKKTRTVYK